MDNRIAFIPEYTSHKQVRADKIVEIDPDLYWKLESGGIIEVYTVRELTQRSAPVIGDYYVLYPDGYESWWTAAAFEQGYTKNA